MFTEPLNAGIVGARLTEGHTHISQPVNRYYSVYSIVGRFAPSESALLSLGLVQMREKFQVVIMYVHGHFTTDEQI